MRKCFRRERGSRTAHREVAHRGRHSRSSDDGECSARPVDRKALDRPGRNASSIRDSCTVFSVEHEGAPDKAASVTILYGRGGKLYRARARAVIMAGGSWTAKRIVRDLLGAPCRLRSVLPFSRAGGECGRTELALPVRRRNSRGAMVREDRQRCGRSENAYFRAGTRLSLSRLASGPKLKILFSYPGLPIGEQVSRGRAELLSTPYREYERRIVEQFAMMFARTGFDAKRDIAGLILNRWGHAYLSPQPGFFFGKDGQPAPGEVLRRNRWAHSVRELGRHRYYGPPSVDSGGQAGRRQVVERLG